MKRVEPDRIEHPYRSEMNEESWDRMSRVFMGNSGEDFTAQELEAYEDWLFDTIAGRLQTHSGSLTIQ